MRFAMLEVLATDPMMQMTDGPDDWMEMKMHAAMKERSWMNPAEHATMKTEHDERMDLP